MESMRLIIWGHDAGRWSALLAHRQARHVWGGRRHRGLQQEAGSLCASSSWRRELSGNPNRAVGRSILARRLRPLWFRFDPSIRGHGKRHLSPSLNPPHGRSLRRQRSAAPGAISQLRKLHFPSYASLRDGEVCHPEHACIRSPNQESLTYTCRPRACPVCRARSRFRIDSRRSLSPAESN